MGDAMRVLHVVTQMNRGGMENRLMDIYRNIDRDQVQFDFYTTRREAGYFDEEIRSLGGRVFYEAPLSIKSLFDIPTRIGAFLVCHPEYRVVHAHLNQWCGPVLEGARRAGVPVRVAHARTALSGGGASVFVKNIVKHLFASSPTHRFAVSKKAALWLYGKHRVEKGLCEVWPNAIDTSRFLYDEVLRRQTREEFGLCDEFCVLHVGNLRPVKNHGYLLRVFAELSKKEADAVLLLAGDGEKKDELTALSETLGISEKVRFLGSRSDIPALLSAADVFVFPSFYEGLPGAVLEAQASDLPAFISDTIAEEVHLNDCLYARSIGEDAALWADAILTEKGHVRRDRSELFQTSGYDVKTLAQRLASFYLSNTRKG